MLPDVLVSGSERPRRSRWWPALVLLLAAGAFAGDRVARHEEGDALAGKAAGAQETVAYADRRVAATVSYTMPLLVSVRQPAGVRAGLARLVQQEAGAQLAPVQQERAAVAAVDLLPWHSDQRRTRRLLLAYLDAELQHLRAAAADARVLFRTDEALDRARAAAGLSP